MATALALGQAGFRLQLGDAVVYIDPYLSDLVADTHGEQLRRMTDPPLSAGDIRDASWVLITHAHADHADPATLGPLAAASPTCRFVCPPPVVHVLTSSGVTPSRIELASERQTLLTPSVELRAIPAAHLAVERDPHGNLNYVGYLLRAEGRSLYHAGDTIPHPEIFDALCSEGPIDYALLPVNERNYYRDAQGIVGNMTVREALQMATDLGAKTMVPIHWDLFGPNSTPRAEVELVYAETDRPFELTFVESGEILSLW